MKNKQSRLLFSKRDQWVRPFFSRYKMLLLLVLLLGVLTFFCGSALMFTSGYLISKAATQPISILLINTPIVLTRAFGVGRPAFRYTERLASHNWVLKMTSDLRLKLYRSLETKAVQASQLFQSGDVLGLLAEDLEHIQNLYLRTIFPTLIAWLLYICLVIGLGLFSFPFALIMLLLLGVLVILFPLVSVLVNQARVYRRKAGRNTLYNELTDSILGVGDWQYSGRYEDFLHHYDQTESQVRKEDAQIKRYSRFQDLGIQVMFSAAIIALFYWTGNYFTDNQESLNWIAAFILAFFPLMDAFAPLSNGVMEYPIYEDTVKRLHELPNMEVQKEIEAPKLTHADIVFKQVSFQYPQSERLILDEFNLTIPEGQIVALLGKSGTGKTTLSKLLRGDLKANSGDVLIGGVPVSQLGEAISSTVGILSQSPYLFNTTIYNNIRLGNLAATDEEIQQAVEQAGLKELVDSLPEGLNTWVEEGGKRFSGGEQQRIALARILLQKVPIVIIDEPTIGLDAITERKLLETVFAALKGKTILWITHHLLGIEHADQVIFLEAGKIVMNGTPKTLKQENLRFQKLYQLDEAE